ncbi:hypothetical protein [Saccharolobus caldissimus]|uniref:Uncharacterized protein n=1 Tax=Saccharolobus caldissimus TaxID=1702097 RepID=A0AAQ4CVD3_9CREN|nr:hypothetical protein [Saccharolobus caldissimus]BDB99764.1 hypothetical protein SACC_27810 [Saccharolobus caldissimus]
MDMEAFYIPSKWVSAKALVALIIGVLLNYYNVFGIVSLYFPYQVLGSLIAATIYYILKKV